MATRDRAQSNVIGVILLTAVIVILVGGFGAVYLGASGGGAADGAPLLDAHVNATADRVMVTHAGGEALQFDDLDVIVRSDATSERYPIDAANVTGDGDARFDPAERFARDHGVGGGQLEVLVVHVESNAVLEHAYLDAG